MSSPIVYLIRHGEKPPKDANGNDPHGLSDEGQKRADGLVNVFGPDSPYNISYIIAQHPKEDGGEDRPYLTVKPLADKLGDSVPFNYTIKRDDADKVAHAVRKFKGSGNILICWEHGRLTDIANAIGIANAPEYPGKRFDLIWTVNDPYNQIDNVTSEQCPGLDEAFKDDKWVQTDGVWAQQNN